MPPAGAATLQTDALPTKSLYLFLGPLLVYTTMSVMCCGGQSHSTTLYLLLSGLKNRNTSCSMCSFHIFKTYSFSRKLMDAMILSNGVVH